MKIPSYFSIMLHGMVVAVLSLFAWGDCGSSATDTDTGGGDTVELSADVTRPTASFSISALGKGPLAQEADEGDTGHFYTMEGEHLGECTVDAEGNCTVTADVADLMGTEDDAASFDEPVVFVTDDGYETYFDASFTEGETSEIGCTCDMDSTLATGEVSDAIDVDGDGVSDFTGWGEDYSAAKDDADFGCLFEVGLAMWEDSALDGEGLADDMGLIGEAIESYLAAGGDPADLGYDSIADMVSASFDGTLDDGSAWTDMLNFLGNAAASDPTAFADWVDPSAYTDMYDDSFVTFEAVHSFYEENIAYGGLRTTAEALTKHQEADDETSLDCDSIKNGDVDPSAFIAPFLAADDLEEFTNTYTGDGFFVYVGLMDDYLAECTDPATCWSGFIDGDDAWTLTGFMAAYGGDYSSVYTGGAFVDATYLDGIWEAALSCGGSGGDAKDCAEAMWGTVYDGGGGWDSFMTDGTFNTATFDAWGSYWTGECGTGFDPGTAGDSYWDSVWDTNYTTFSSWDSTAADAIGTCIDEQIAAGSYDYSSCYGDTFTYTSYTGYEGWNSGAEEGSAVCGDYICSGDETADNCLNDCDSDYYSDNPYYGLYCGDGACSESINETAQSCDVDCGTHDESYTFCGNHTCESGETASTCSYDCGEWCGNGTCGEGETSYSCAADCGSEGGGSSCNYNHTCDAGETVSSCYYDCGSY